MYKIKAIREVTMMKAIISSACVMESPPVKDF